MSEPENFLSRWSRRKRVADETPEQAQPDPASPNLPTPSSEAAPQPPAVAPPEEAFDPASLPSLDSIDAQTDIRGFLKAGVPSDLRLAALRRAWSADPAIRDFKGLAENDWDFNAPNSMLGFGELDPGTDVKKMLAQLFGETPAAEEPPTEIPAPVAQMAPPPGELSPPAEAPAPESSDNESPQVDNMVQREENIAVQDDAHADEAQTKPRRSQGSALPQ